MLSYVESSECFAEGLQKVAYPRAQEGRRASIGKSEVSTHPGGGSEDDYSF